MVEKRRLGGFTIAAKKDFNGTEKTRTRLRMAHFWLVSARAAGACWAALPLSGSAYIFVDAEPFVRRVESLAEAARGAALLRVNGEAAAEQWLLVVPPGAKLRVNGSEMLLGAHILADRDELRLAGHRRLCFSTERLPRIIPFPGADHVIFCARCRGPIDKDSPAVLCPGCGAWCHQTDDLPCWSYPGTTRCPLCEQSNDPEAGFRWIPEALTHEI